MTTEKKHSQAAKRRSILKTQHAWRRLSSKAHIRAQPEGGGRAKSGSSGQGEYYHIEVRPKGQFAMFRTHDVGRKGGIQRVAGKRRTGSWDDHTWLISKEHAHVENGVLVPDTRAARDVLETLGSRPRHVTGDRFRAKPRPNVSEKSKPTSAQRRAQQRNIQKAQAARWKP